MAQVLRKILLINKMMINWAEKRLKTVKGTEDGGLDAMRRNTAEEPTALLSKN